MSTLEEAGYLYSPFTTADIFGHPPPFNLTQINNKTLPHAHDTSALPGLSDPAFTSKENILGSGQGHFRKQTNLRVMANANSMSTLIFAVVVVAAVLWTRKGSL